MHKKIKSDDKNLQDNILLGKSNDVSIVEKEVTTANQWNDVEKCHDTSIAIKNCTGTCKY